MSGQRSLLDSQEFKAGNARLFIKSNFDKVCIINSFLRFVAKIYDLKFSNMSYRTFVKRQRPVGYGTQGRMGRAAAMARLGRATATMRARNAVVRNRAPRVKGAVANYGGRKELKYVDIAEATYACDTTGTVTYLNLLAVGDDNNTRDGRQVTVKSVAIHGYLTPVDNVTATSISRVLFVWDNAANSGSPTAAQMIALVLNASSGTAFPTIDNAQRFTILRDIKNVIGGNNNTATQTYAYSPTVALIDEYIKINQVTQYSGTTAAASSIQNGALMMITIGDQAAGVGCKLVASIRTRFTDN